MSLSSHSIRRALSKKDISKLLALQEACWPPDFRSTYSEVIEHTLRPWNTYIAHERGSRFISGAIVTTEIDSLLIIDSIEVLSAYRRHGIATSLLGYALTRSGDVSYAVGHAVTMGGYSFLVSQGFSTCAMTTEDENPTLMSKHIIRG